ncbi:TasA family protein [Thermococcus sp.]|uniref:TasA family protein n=1 Tax=Thermococcus sp. TaxID=35749 RepID=UPI0025D57360|nr:TasA family protein [Thermococcus sp.]
MKRTTKVVLALILVVTAGISKAIFTDTAISRGNSIETAEFDIAISKDGKRFYNELKLFEMSNFLPGETRKSEFQIKNRGTVEVKKLTITFKVRNYEVRMSPSEKAVDSTPETGELGKWLVLKAIRIGGNNITINQTLNTLNGKTITLPVKLNPGETAKVEMMFELPEDAGNECQTDGIDVTLRLDASQ